MRKLLIIIICIIVFQNSYSNDFEKKQLSIVASYFVLNHLSFSTSNIESLRKSDLSFTGFTFGLDYGFSKKYFSFRYGGLGQFSFLLDQNEMTEKDRFLVISKNK